MENLPFTEDGPIETYDNWRLHPHFSGITNHSRHSPHFPPATSRIPGASVSLLRWCSRYHLPNDNRSSDGPEGKSTGFTGYPILKHHYDTMDQYIYQFCIWWDIPILNIAHHPYSSIFNINLPVAKPISPVFFGRFHHRSPAMSTQRAAPCAADEDRWSAGPRRRSPPRTAEPKGPRQNVGNLGKYDVICHYLYVLTCVHIKSY